MLIIPELRRHTKDCHQFKATLELPGPHSKTISKSKHLATYVFLEYLHDEPYIFSNMGYDVTSLCILNPYQPRNRIHITTWVFCTPSTTKIIVISNDTELDLKDTARFLSSI